MADVLKETRTLYDLGFAIHWLAPKSKRPIEKKWTKGNRKSWDELKKSYRPGLNVGVRLGTASKLSDGRYLGAVDCDVKSTDPRHLGEMTTALRKLGIQGAPSVVSGRGNGSRHHYVATKKPLSPSRFMQSGEKIAVHMPSVRPTPAELRILGPEKTKQGLRLRPAWEISIMGEGQQVVLPSSIHPDSGKMYRWAKTPGETKSIPSLTLPRNAPNTSVNSADGGQNEYLGPDRKFVPLDVDLLSDARGVPDRLADLILNGSGCTDRSAALFGAARDLSRLGFSENEILSVLSDRSTFLGNCAYDHVGSGDRLRAVKWLRRYTTAKGVADVKEEQETVSGSLGIVDAAQAEQEVIAAGFTPFVEGEGKEVADWRRSIDRTGKDGNGPPAPTVKNIVLILTNAVAADIVRRDLFRMRDMYGVKTPWGGTVGTALTDTDVNLIRLWIAENYRFEPDAQRVIDALDVVASHNAFHPLRDYLNALPPWDGVERLDHWLKEKLDAEGPGEYLAQAFRKWMVAAVSRIFKPGTQFDWMLVLEGNQGVGKSTFFRKLAGEEFFRDNLPDLRDKDSAQALDGTWIVELGEVEDYFKKNMREIFKAYLSRKVDKYRPVYGRKQIEAHRQCVFAGSTNEERFLYDEDENRRVVPVKLRRGGKIDWDANDLWRDQLWAEALVIYRMGLEESLELEGEAKEYAIKTRSTKRIQTDSDLMRERLLEWREEMESRPDSEKMEFDFDKFSLRQLFEAAGPFGVGTDGLNWRYSIGMAIQAGRALSRLGAQKKEIMGRNFWSWKQAVVPRANFEMEEE